MAGINIPPLNSITLPSRPITSHALSWSCDGELAVAGDDSVHILAPEFPSIPEQVTRPCTEHDLSLGEGAVAAAGGSFVGGAAGTTRPQFSSRRHFAASNPQVGEQVNRELFVNAGERWPYDEKGQLVIGQAGLRRRILEGSDADDDEEDDEEEEDVVMIEDDADSDVEETPTHASMRSRTHGAEADEQPSAAVDPSYRSLDSDAGPIASAGTTLNHVVALEWSPSGVGRNGRPVLAVLTASGVITVYGDGPGAASLGISGLAGEGHQRSLDSWVKLWAVGDKILVPGQRLEEKNLIRSFSWAKQLVFEKGDRPDGDVAFLSYRNDRREIVILCVRSNMEGGMKWHVREIARFMADGPHPRPSLWDADFTPTGTAFGLRWSPWGVNGSQDVAVVAYVDHHYIGFRRVVVTKDADTLTVDADDADCEGSCVNLSTDAFVEWENRILVGSNGPIYRVVLATPFEVRYFTVSLAAAKLTTRRSAHDTAECKTTYSNSEDPSDPIIGLALHPELGAEEDIPRCSWVRQSATPQSHHWYQTTGPLQPDKDGRPSLPQWAATIQHKLGLIAPANLEADEARSEAGSDSEDDGDNAKDVIDDPAAEDDFMAETASEGRDRLQLGTTPKRKLIYPFRFRFHGMAASPGGGATAVLVSEYSTREMARNAFFLYQSTLHFATRPMGSLSRSDRQLTTEGKMLEWMYGGGSGVPGVTEPKVSMDGEVDNSSTIRQIFKSIPGMADCDVCEVPLVVPYKGAREGRCPARGHVFDLCTISGVAIQEPGISLTCGVCGARCLTVEAMVRLAPDHEDVIRKELSAERCGNCGGKFLD